MMKFIGKYDQPNTNVFNPRSSDYWNSENDVMVCGRGVARGVSMGVSMANESLGRPSEPGLRVILTPLLYATLEAPSSLLISGLTLFSTPLLFSSSSLSSTSPLLKQKQAAAPG
jgi:hypothetical protein